MNEWEIMKQEKAIGGRGENKTVSSLRNRAWGEGGE